LASGLRRIAEFKIRKPIEALEEDASLPPDTERALSGLKFLSWTLSDSRASGPEGAARALAKLASEFPKTRDVQIALAKVALERVVPEPVRLVSNDISNILNYEHILGDVGERLPNDRDLSLIILDARLWIDARLSSRIPLAGGTADEREAQVRNRHSLELIIHKYGNDKRFSDLQSTLVARRNAIVEDAVASDGSRAKRLARREPILTKAMQGLDDIMRDLRTKLDRLQRKPGERPDDPGPVEFRGTGDLTLTFRCIPALPAINRPSMIISITGDPAGDDST
jgi:hypothetical protein